MSKTLEIDIRSAEGLKRNRKPINKRKTFAVIKIGEKSRKSNLDESGGSNSTWNYKSDNIPMNGSVQFIFIEVYYLTGTRRREKKIGEAKIPVSDFVGRYSPEGHFNFLSYRLRDEYGDKCGIVNLSILVKSSSSSSSESKQTVIQDYSGACSSQAGESGLWRPRTDTRPEIGGYGGRIVTGVPVWWEIQRQR